MSRITSEGILTRNRYVHQWFESEASAHPNAPCLVADGTTLSFGEVNAQSNRLAHHLRALGVGPDSCVAVAVDRGPEMVVCVLAISRLADATCHSILRIRLSDSA